MIGARQRIFRRTNARSDLCWCDCRFFPDRNWICARVREAEVKEMALESMIAVAVSVLLLIYLTYALLRPEKF